MYIYLNKISYVGLKRNGCVLFFILFSNIECIVTVSSDYRHLCVYGYIYDAIPADSLDFDEDSEAKDPHASDTASYSKGLPSILLLIVSLLRC